jgi:predicted DsbA family dithiol-disulfide isomerase
MTDIDAKTDPEFPFVVFGDFVCPWSFAVIPLIDRLAAEYGLRPWWRPHLLHPETPPGGEPITDTSRREEVQAWFREMAPESAARMRFRDRTVPTFEAFQALEWADDHGHGWAFKTAVFDALWVDGRDISDHAMLADIASTVGLDGDALARALAGGDYVERTVAAANQARRVGVTATPTIMLGRTRIDGWHYYEVMQSVVERQGRAPVAV